MRRVCIATLGCRLNQFESDSLASSFLSNGYELVSFKERADAYIINSCSVTAKSDAKTRNYINRTRRLNPLAKVFLTGCYAKDNLDSFLSDDFYIVANTKKYALFNIVDSILDDRELSIESIGDDNFGYYLGGTNLRARNYLKIQDGCDESCSYCKVPLVRGKAQTRLATDIFRDIELMLSSGVREIVLTGINISAYSSLDNYTLDTLLSRILSFPGDFRIHLSSIEPNNITKGLIDLLGDSKLCKHLHIPLQSASNKVLSSMNRNYTRQDYYEVIERIRKQRADINITTDLILGFPGEEEEDFLDTYSFLEDFAPSYIHTFKYSRREGTAAFDYAGQVSELEKSRRSSLIRSLSSRLNFEYRKGFLGRVLTLIPEKDLAGGLQVGYTDYYIRVSYSGSNGLNGFRKVLIEDIDEHASYARALV